MWGICGERASSTLLQGTDHRALQVCKSKSSQVLTCRFGKFFFSWAILYWKTVIQENHHFSQKLTSSDQSLSKNKLWRTRWNLGTDKEKEPLQHTGIQSIQLAENKRVWLSLDQKSEHEFSSSWVSPVTAMRSRRALFFFCAFPKNSSNISWGYVKLELFLNLRASQDKKIISQQRYPISGSFHTAVKMSLWPDTQKPQPFPWDSVLAGGTQTLLRWVCPDPH